MATVKKKNTSRSPRTTKGKAKARPLTWRFYVVAIGIFTIAVATVIVISLLTASIVSRVNTQARLDRITSVYAAINVGDDYMQTSSRVFGDKRPYSWDAGRTESSVIEFVRADTVSNTVADLDAKIKAAGFTMVGEPYPGSVFVQYHYKNADGVFVRMTVGSKPYEDATFNAYKMQGSIPDSVFELDKNAGPANVTLKVNLDDNNE